MVSLDDEPEGALQEKRVNIFMTTMYSLQNGVLEFPGSESGSECLSGLKLTVTKTQ